MRNHVENFYPKFNKYLLYWIDRKMKDREAARDVAQAVWLSVLQMDDTEIVKPLAYLYIVARSEISNRLNKYDKKEQSTRPIKYAMGRRYRSRRIDVSIESVDPTHATQMQIDAELLLGKLHGRQQECMELFLTGFTAPEIAGYLGLAELTVEEHLKMAKLNLRKLVATLP